MQKGQVQKFRWILLDIFPNSSARQNEIDHLPAINSESLNELPTALISLDRVNNDKKFEIDVGKDCLQPPDSRQQQFQSTSIILF